MTFLTNLAGFLANIATIVGGFGIPLAIYALYLDRSRARREKEEQTFQFMQSEYSDFLKLAMDKPKLQLYAYDPESPELTNDRMIALHILVSMFESAFFLYNQEHENEFKTRQWTGWEKYIEGWAQRPDFQTAWKEHNLGNEYDSAFFRYVDRMVQPDKYEGEIKPPVVPVSRWRLFLQAIGRAIRRASATVGQWFKRKG